MTKLTEKLAGELTAGGRAVSADTVGRLLKEDGYSLQGNAKTVEGHQHPDRDGQFRFINELVREFQAAGEPVISVDTKKKELAGNYRNGGREWQPRSEPERVEVHDFKGELGRAVPYGVYDMTANAGRVNLGTDADTGAFAVESIRRWWQKIGQAAYPHATRLLITADAGGSNGSRLRLWKVELARLAHELGREISVSHFPPGTSPTRPHRRPSHRGHPGHHPGRPRHAAQPRAQHHLEGGGQALACSVDDELPDELGEGGEYVEDQPAAGRGGVQVLVQEVNPTSRLRRSPTISPSCWVSPPAPSTTTSRTCGSCAP